MHEGAFAFTACTKHRMRRDDERLRPIAEIQKSKKESLPRTPMRRLPRARIARAC
jgi:hypothetical protein